LDLGIKGLGVSGVRRHGPTIRRGAERGARGPFEAGRGTQKREARRSGMSERREVRRLDEKGRGEQEQDGHGEV